MYSFVCVDIITTDKRGITVWGYDVPASEYGANGVNDGSVPFIDLVYPARRVPSVAEAIAYAKAKLGDFTVLDIKTESI